MTASNALMNIFLTKRLKQIEQFMLHPIEIQQKTLLDLVTKAKNTEWGEKYGYKEMQSNINIFTERIPIQKYSDLKPYVDRMQNGEKNLLWPTPTNWFSKSSGTTSEKSKFIPVSPEALKKCHYQAGKDILAIYNKNYPQNKIVQGKSLALGGSHRLGVKNNRSGDVSAILIHNLPLWAQLLRTPKKKIALLSDWDIKIEEIARNTIPENVTNIAGVPSWVLHLLQRILQITGAKEIHEVWPNLEAFFHGGVSFKPYKEQFNSIINSNIIHYMETFNASEGFFALQDDPRASDMLLMLDYDIYYEFIPTNEIGRVNPTIYDLSQVKVGTNYIMIITTNAGLWRYEIGDTVTFTSILPYKIIISGRTMHYINAFGEELIVNNADTALSRACKQTNSIIAEYTAAPIYMKNNTSGQHEWIIEFKKTPASIDEFTIVLDTELQSLNSDYEAKRFKNKILALPIIKQARHNLFYDWLKSKNKLGGQNKIPRLSNNRKYVDALNKLMIN